MYRGQEEQGRSSEHTARIVIADDHPLMRAALKQMLSMHPDMDVVGEAADGMEALKLCRHLRPRIALLDVRMPKMDGVEATRHIKREIPSVTVLLLTAYREPEYLLEAIKAGASGHLLKEAGIQEIYEAISRVIEGESALDQEVAMQLLARLIEQEETQEVDERMSGLPRSGRPSSEALGLPTPAQVLTPRELEVLRLLARGHSNQQIAENLYLSLSTVKNHVHRIIKKLGVSDRTQAARLAIEHGLAAVGSTELLALPWLMP